MTLTVCAGPDTVPVPDLKGQTRRRPSEQLETTSSSADFDEVDSSQPKDQVISVDQGGHPVEARHHDQGQDLQGQPALQVPDVVGKSERGRRGPAGNAGFDVNVEDGQQVQDANLVGKVIDQDPDGDQEAKKGSTVTIMVTVLEEPDDDPSTDPTSPPPGGNNGGIGDILPGIGGGGRPMASADRAHRAERSAGAGQAAANAARRRASTSAASSGARSSASG